MNKKAVLFSLMIPVIISLPCFAEEKGNKPPVPEDQAQLYNQLLNQMQNSSPAEMEKAVSDPDLQTLMGVMKLVQDKSYKEAIPVLENLIKNPKGKSLTPQSIMMINNLINVMQFMGSEYDDAGNP
jgi:hypothetical protein